MRIFCPADRAELLAGLPAVVADLHPWYIRYNDKPARLSHDADFAPGRAEIRGDEGAAEIALVTYGFLTGETWTAAEQLRGDGLTVRFVNLRTLAPLDEAALLAAAEADLVVTVEDHLRTGGLYALLCELLVRRGRRARVLPLALDTWFKPALLADVLEHEGFTAAQIARRARGGLETREVDDA
jgi:transketolase